MPGPKLGCGGTGQPACPPDNAAVINGISYYTAKQMQEHGAENYRKGSADVVKRISDVIEDPNHGWGDGEMARAIRAATI